MGEMNEFSLVVRAFLMAYPWKRIDPVPWSHLAKPLADSRLALVSSAGLVCADQPGFDDTVKGGDVSFREIPRDTDVASLIETHRSDSFDHSGVNTDPNVAFPLDRVRELKERGRIGEVNHRHLSFMGSITAPGRLVRDSATAMAGLMKQDRVDVALLVPV